MFRILRLLAVMAACMLLAAGGFLAAETWEFYRSVGNAEKRAELVERIGWSGILAGSLKYSSRRLFAALPLVDKAELWDSGLPQYELFAAQDDLEPFYQSMFSVAPYVFSGYGLPDKIGVKKQTSPKVWVEGRFRSDGRTYPVKFRSRGGSWGHFRPWKPSLYLKFSKQLPFQGARRWVSISQPTDKKVSVDAAMMDEMAAQGLIAPRHQFALMKLNGKVLGVYQFFEAFKKDILLRFKRSEGVIFKGLTGTIQQDQGGSAGKLAKRAMQDMIPCFSMSRSPKGCDYDTFFSYIDERSWALTLAYITLIKGGHGFEDNLRLYFDAAKGKFEPIVWDMGARSYEEDGDCETIAEIDCYADISTDAAVPLLLNEAFRLRRDQLLWQIMQTRLGAIRSRAETIYQAVAPSLVLEDASGKQFFKYVHERFLYRLQRNVDLLTLQYRHAKLVMRPITSERFRVFNYGRAAISISISGRRYTVAGQHADQPGQIEITARDGLNAAVITNLVTNEVISQARVEIDNDHSAPIMEPIHTAASLSLPKGLTFRLVGKTLQVSSGQQTLREDFVVPAGYELRIPAGTTIRIAGGKSIVVLGDLTIAGTPDRPVTIEPLSHRPFGSVAVLGTSDDRGAVKVAHLHMRGGRGTEWKGVYFSASFSAHVVEARIEHSRFTESVAEDGFNLKYCDLRMNNVLVTKSADDAVDIDFCRGSIIDSTVRKSGGDGFDFSGSKVSLRGARVYQYHDKGLSIGEASNIVAEQTHVEAGSIGFAVKDGSSAIISDSSAEDVALGVSMYQKKPSFGNASLAVQKSRFVGIDAAYLVEDGMALQFTDTTMKHKNGSFTDLGRYAKRDEGKS